MSKSICVTLTDDQLNKLASIADEVTASIDERSRIYLEDYVHAKLVKELATLCKELVKSGKPPATAVDAYSKSEVYRKTETYSKSEVYAKGETYSKAQIDELLKKYQPISPAA